MANQIQGQRHFGSGRFFAANSNLYSTPVPGPLTQDWSLDFKRDAKRLYSQNQVAVDVAAGSLVVTGKANLGGLSARMLNDLVIAGTLTANSQNVLAQDEALTVVANATAGGTLANGAALQMDLGIYGATDFVPLVKVSTGAVLAIGQYALSTLGVIILSSLDSRTKINASYLYSTVGGQTVSITNQPMGKAGNFASALTMAYGVDKGTFYLENCMATDLSYASKLDDFMKPSIGWESGAGADGNLGYGSFAELT